MGWSKDSKLLSCQHFVQYLRLATLSIMMGLLWSYRVGFAQDIPCGVWVIRNALQNPEEWSAALTAVERLGCRRLYLQVSGRWDAYYPSGIFPAPAAAPRGAGWEDPLARAIAEAHERGLEVHAWVNALLAWSSPDLPPDPDHVFRSRPEWFVTDARGQSMRRLSRDDLDRLGLVGEGWFLDPARAEVRSELRRFLLELATRYPIEGVHLDYIRYPSGWAPANGEAVTRLVELIRADLSAVRRKARLSAAVMPHPGEARRSFGQDWEDWIARGIVDEVAPMVYGDRPSAVLSVVARYPASVPRERLWVGLRLDRLDPGEVLETAARLRREGVAGLVLFSHNLILEDPAWRRAGRIGSAPRGEELPPQRGLSPSSGR